MDWISDPNAWIALSTLTLLEIVLGIDNIIFVAILAERVEKSKRAKARQVGLTLAVGVRVLLLLSIVWIMGLTAPLFAVLGHDVSGHDMILIAGGMFLLFKSTREIHHKLEGDESTRGGAEAAASFASVIVQITLLDIVFSLDSVITAVGMVSHVPVMIAAIVVAVLVMMLCAGAISNFIDKHPSLKMLALSFLIVVGTVLIAEAFDVHVPKGYVYFAMAFSLGVEAINIRMRTAMARKEGKDHEPVKLRKDIPGQ